ncbi:hypothetical protein JK364_22280 [Streptomyces sp. 110]|uniref:Uncharacterized protein n=1 Tax=Streptomyces endocoffeicus TaxID=2898945 RepID=A0ABS1PRN7_9ACTN|nr:hypothetical protein [Streptomyces endocoffeicus]
MPEHGRRNERNTGANKGIGFETAKQLLALGHVVYIGARDVERGRAGSFWAVTNPDRPEFNLPLALYSASKSAATMLTVQYAKSQPGIKFNAVEPGTTATDLTAAFGIGRAPEESARVVVRLATLDADGPSGTFQDENGEVPW